MQMSVQQKQQRASSLRQQHLTLRSLNLLPSGFNLLHDAFTDLLRRRRAGRTEACGKSGCCATSPAKPTHWRGTHVMDRWVCIRLTQTYMGSLLDRKA